MVSLKIHEHLNHRICTFVESPHKHEFKRKCEYMGVSRNGGSPKMVGFCEGNSSQKMDDGWRVPLWLRKPPYVSICIAWGLDYWIGVRHLVASGTKIGDCPNWSTSVKKCRATPKKSAQAKDSRSFCLIFDVPWTRSRPPRPPFPKCNFRRQELGPMVQWQSWWALWQTVRWQAKLYFTGKPFWKDLRTTIEMQDSGF